MEKNPKKGKAGVRVGVVAGLIVGIMLLSLVIPVPEVNWETGEIHFRMWHPNVLGDNDPGAGASGVLRVYVVEHGHYTYTSNITQSDAEVYEWGDLNNSHLGSNVPYSTAFDIVVKVRWNRTHAWNTTVYELGWVRGNITCSAFTLSDDAMDEYNITGCGTPTYIWVHYVWDGTTGGGGSGEQISRGQNVTSCSFTFDAYY